MSTCPYCEHSARKAREGATLFCTERAIWVFDSYRCDDYERYPGADDEEEQ